MHRGALSKHDTRHTHVVRAVVRVCAIAKVSFIRATLNEYILFCWKDAPPFFVHFHVTGDNEQGQRARG
eukprot:m.369243 g.369243  ORF g.369243 m.369243 type:complete len:69 (-) comp20846_c0_seq2:2175-2381(-)